MSVCSIGYRHLAVCGIMEPDQNPSTCVCNCHTVALYIEKASHVKSSGF